MSHRVPNLWSLAVAAAPFLLGNLGCHRTVDEKPASNLTDNSTVTDAGDPKRPAELEPCDKCDGPAPLSPNTMCKDGSIAGPVCAKKDLGECGWLLRACPEDDEPVTCGGLQGAGCPDEQYCQFDKDCGAADKTGICTVKPTQCATIYAPVCGCDGKTYGSACEASAKGMSVVSEGECKSDGGDPQACSSCQGPMPGAPSVKCADGSIAGPSCVFDKVKGMCGWVITQCPPSRDPCQGFPCKKGTHCSAPADAPMCVPDGSNCSGTVTLPSGACWVDSDCKTGTCMGASCCPPGANCFAPDKPGKCG